jgi:GxxExxY protein
MDAGVFAFFAQRKQRNAEIAEKARGQELAPTRTGGMLEAQEMDSATILNGLSHRIIGAAIEVHKALGPGLLESAYEACLAYELRSQGLKVETQKAVPVIYHQVRLDCGYRLDLLVEQVVIVEVKAVEALESVHQAQILSYLRLTGLSLGLLINFNSAVLTQGVRRVVNHFGE